MSSIVITGLRTYPIKSLGGFESDWVQVEKRGFQYDRRWLLVDENNVFLTQRSDTRMALYRTECSSNGLVVSNPNKERMVIPYVPEGDRRMVQIWSSHCDAVQVNATVDEWFSDFLGIRCSLVFMPDDSVRPTSPSFSKPDDMVSFADGYPVMIAGESSLEDLNGRLEVPLPMNRFRPNIIVSGSAPFEEDIWKSCKTGEVELRSTKLCGRCSVTATNQETGEVGIEPLKTLASYRLRDQSINFGAYFVPDRLGQIRVGETLATSE